MDKQIDIGKHSRLVVEILDFLDDKRLLKPSEGLVISHSLDDLDLAQQAAWEDVYGDDELTWSDIRSDKMSEIWEEIYSHKDYEEVDLKLSRLMDDLDISIQTQLPELYAELLDDMVSDFKGCLYSRAVFGKENAFFEDIFSSYVKGGWPCGCSQDKIIVFIPKT
ncbi:hypothetical protein L3V77_10585 [Vibrio sp. DW001]|uniref:hypothetical protein n=1 Tax=Vibrio sp. DW001 TaxID=2912315 RepID=UPI0023AF88B8|nr:hypothetical protein [Vibrio sp. DW001]WED25513.1 hypothetical protein L3V77_10585 [Vibrio sp. DW001]